MSITVSTSRISKQLAVILSHYNGEKYLSEQVNSILNQTYRSLHIFIFDDASDKEVKLEALKKLHSGPIQISLGLREKNIGFAKNFLNSLSLINKPFKYFAFSDQDDIWHPDKLENAIQTLKKHPSNRPALYCARTNITDEICHTVVGTSPLFSRPPSFANALVQSIGGGNTMVLNGAARDLVTASASCTEVVSHDWWCYQIVSGAGGIVVYDKNPCLKYRQHGNNLAGANQSWKARLIRIKGLFQGRYRRWNDINLSALVKNRALLTKENQKYLDDIIEARNSNVIKRLFIFYRSGIRRQTLLGNLGLFAGLIINKV